MRRSVCSTSRAALIVSSAEASRVPAFSASEIAFVKLPSFWAGMACSFKIASAPETGSAAKRSARRHKVSGEKVKISSAGLKRRSKKMDWSRKRWTRASVLLMAALPRSSSL